MTEDMLKDLEKRRVITHRATRVPPSTDVYANPKDDEVIVFKDFFTTGLCFPLEPAVVDIFRR